MAEQQIEQNEQCLGDDDTDHPGYKPPAQKSIAEIAKLDAEDESLRKYKETLLGKATDYSQVAPKPDDPRQVIVEKLVFCSTGRPEIEMDLTGDLKKVEKTTFAVKEGSQYHLKIYFYVQREIVAGLKFKQKITRKGIQVDKHEMMVGSYAPKMELHMFKTAMEDVPSGMMSRGTYLIKNTFTDDDKQKILEWDFKLEIKKEWDD